MALPANFSLLHSELNAFLFAHLGEEENGLPLTVLSALTRLGADPWAEAPGYRSCQEMRRCGRSSL